MCRIRAIHELLLPMMRTRQEKSDVSKFEDVTALKSLVMVRIQNHLYQKVVIEGIPDHVYAHEQKGHHQSGEAITLMPIVYKVEAGARLHLSNVSKTSC
ncbi:hypothetical protein ACJMK2_018185 [Sinanodonta woodiana]|uniref:Uncharacterized protein n=1 Tax=Sinanodonta woodiana TaxID=1069815 RepID=A0ABD3UCZ2_SINWO